MSPHPADPFTELTVLSQAPLVAGSPAKRVRLNSALLTGYNDLKELSPRELEQVFAYDWNDVVFE